jgi:hypothetical protein
MVPSTGRATPRGPHHHCHRQWRAIRVAHSRPMTQARCKTTPPQLGKGQHSLKRHHDTTSKHLTAPDPTTKVALDQHRCRRGAPPSCRSARCTHALAGHDQPGPTTARPPSAAASHNHNPAICRPAMASHNRRPPTTGHNHRPAATASQASLGYHDVQPVARAPNHSSQRRPPPTSESFVPATATAATSQGWQPPSHPTRTHTRLPWRGHWIQAGFSPIPKLYISSDQIFRHKHGVLNVDFKTN